MLNGGMHLLNNNIALLVVHILCILTQQKATVQHTVQAVHHLYSLANGIEKKNKTKKLSHRTVWKHVVHIHYI